MRNLLLKLHIIQKNKTDKRRRLNPWNPLSYLTIIITLIVGIIMFGFVGLWKEVDSVNPFKWT